MISLLKKTTTALLIIAMSVLLVNCSNKEKGAFTVKVHFSNADKMIPQLPDGVRDSAFSLRSLKIMLEEIPYGGDMNPILLDSTSLNGNKGTITLKGSGKEESIYQLAISNGPALLLINDGDEIEVDIDLSKKDNYYTVKGSEGSEQLRNFINQYSEKGFAVNKSFTEMDSLKQFGGTDSLLILATNKKNNAMKSLNTYLQQQLTASKHPALSLFILGMSSRSFAKTDFEKELAATVKKFPEHATLAKLKTTYDMQQREMEAQQQSKASSWVGKAIPELTMNDVNGKPVSISSFKGKYVLVDFWASWCGPCRMENPNVVKAYQKFKNKNFTILGVSLDKEKDKWVEAIAKDGLTWTHMSDLLYWNSKSVEVFHFDGIPFNVLVDPKGMIVAEALRGDALEAKLAELMP